MENEVSKIEIASPYSLMYKYNDRTSTSLQEKRRLFLLEQKQKRSAALDELRDLTDLFTPGYSRPRKHTRKPPVEFKLMQADWLTEIPDDFFDNWLVKLCPEGMRCLIIAYNGITSCYVKPKKPLFQFKSKLPGGGCNNPNKFTVLDCVYNKTAKTYLVYDVLAWNSLSLLNAEAQTRFYWLRSKFQEEPEMFHMDQTNNKGFALLDCFPATLMQDALCDAIVVADSQLSCDCVLFYHADGYYTFGQTPLVCWLKSFMVTEVLGIDVPELHLKNRPGDYVGIHEYMDRQKNRKTRVQDVEMKNAQVDVECD